MVQRRKNNGNKRADSSLRANASPPHDASDRAAIPKRFHILTAARAGPKRTLLPRAQRLTESRTNLPQLALPRRGQSPLEGEVP